jgi:hypothetical protein
MSPEAIEVEAEGLALVDAYEAARRALGEWRPPPNPCFVLIFGAAYCFEGTCPCEELCAHWVAHIHTLRVALEEAHDDLWLHVHRYGEVEVEGGTYAVNGDGLLSYRRHARARFSRN